MSVTKPHQEAVITLVTTAGSYNDGQRVYDDVDKARSHGFTTTEENNTYAFETFIDLRKCVDVTPTGTMISEAVYKNNSNFRLTGIVSQDGDSLFCAA